jgi:hypothetical protein
MICRECVLTNIKKEQKIKKEWINDVKPMLFNKLHNNEPFIADLIISYIYHPSDMIYTDFCYCDEITNNYYHYICSDCLGI